ncbi:hypothetical protein V2J09_019713 [Rumex salicifolius]
MSWKLKRKGAGSLVTGDDSDGEAPAKKAAKNDDSTGDNDSTVVCEISKNRRVSVRSWQGKPIVDIREFYVKDGKQMPGKKGISLTMDQWKVLKEHVNEIDQAVGENPYITKAQKQNLMKENWCKLRMHDCKQAEVYIKPLHNLKSCNSHHQLQYHISFYNSSCKPRLDLSASNRVSNCLPDSLERMSRAMFSAETAVVSIVLAAFSKALT